MEKAMEKPCLTATMMGAVPYRDFDYCSNIILENFPQAPCLPVMTRSIHWMLEGIPCIVIDREKRIIYMDASPDREEEILEFYDAWERTDLDYFATTPATAPFYHKMLDRIKAARPPELKWVVFHTAGPVLLGDTFKQIDGRPAIHHETLRDILIKGTNMKARWLERKIREDLPGVEVVADLPETTLVNFTSSGGTGSREEIVEAIDLGFDGLTCTTWIHCCANIDWALLMDTRVNVINFDAYAYAEQASLYADRFKAFIDRGGMIGWGIVPVIAEDLEKETAESLTSKMEKAIGLFVDQGLDEERLVEASWILPSCETVLLTQDQSDRVLDLTRKISERVREKYGFTH